MNDLIEDVREFHDAGGVPNPPDFPFVPSEERIKMRLALQKEENKELRDALKARDLTEIADGCMDLIYVTLGTLIECGLCGIALKLWDEVQATNMAKFTGGLVLSPEGKILKPEGWSPPDIAHIIRRAQGCI